LLVSAMVQVPTVMGWLRPVVLMPAGALMGLPGEQVEALLLHELAHIRRADYLVNLVQSAVEALLFYHPRGVVGLGTDSGRA
jgi:beta-lactamase regulating signal transducer with metallopeptidase domain